jgi:hypothetical protein
LEDFMKIGAPRFLRRSAAVGAAGLLMAMVAACTGVGGGYLPPGASALDPDAGEPDQVFSNPPFSNAVFTGQAPFGFTFSCEDRGGLNPPTGRLGIQLAYADLGTSLLLGAPFSIHGVVDTIKPGDEWIESAICIGQNPPPGDNQLIFLGRYRPTSTPPPKFPASCPARETKTSPLCRFEVIVRDNDGNLAPSKGDFFSIKLSSATVLDCDTPGECSQLDPAKVFYARAGFLAGGNVTVD